MHVCLLMVNFEILPVLKIIKIMFFCYPDTVPCYLRSSTVEERFCFI